MMQKEADILERFGLPLNGVKLGGGGGVLTIEQLHYITGTCIVIRFLGRLKILRFYVCILSQTFNATFFV